MRGRRALSWIFILVLVASLVPARIPVAEADGEAWLDGFAYRRAYTINGSTAGALTDYLIPATIFTGDAWTRSSANPLLALGAGGTFDDKHHNFPRVVYNGTHYFLYYSGNDSPLNYVGLAIGTDGENFTKITNGIGGTAQVLDLGAGGQWDDRYVWSSTVIFNASASPPWVMFYCGRKVATNAEAIGVANSTDGINWVKSEANPILSYGGVGWRQRHLCHQDVVWDAENSMWVMLVSGMEGVGDAGTETIGRYNASASNYPLTWTEDAGNPVIINNEQPGVDDYHVYHPNIYPEKVNGLWYIHYTSSVLTSTVRTISFATTDNLTYGSFTKNPGNPIIKPRGTGWEQNQVLMPNVKFKIGDYYHFYYTGQDSGGNSLLGLVRSKYLNQSGDTGSSLGLTEVSLDWKVQVDLDDIRFTASDGDTLIPFANRYGLGSERHNGSISVYIKIPTIPASPDNVTIYMYYGNATETSGDSPANTYLLADDFNDASLNATVWNSHKNGNPGATVSESGGLLSLAGQPNTDSSGAVSSKLLTLTDSFRVEGYRKVTHGHYGTIDVGYGTVAGEGGVNWWNTNYDDGYHVFRSASNGLLDRRDAGGSTILVGATPISAPNVWYDEIFTYNQDGNWTFYTTGGSMGPVTDTTHQANPKGLLLAQGEHNGGNGGITTYDWITVRAYVDPEPLGILWGSEESAPASNTAPSMSAYTISGWDGEAIYTDEAYVNFWLQALDDDGGTDVATIEFAILLGSVWNNFTFTISTGLWVKDTPGSPMFMGSDGQSTVGNAKTVMGFMWIGEGATETYNVVVYGRATDTSSATSGWGVVWGPAFNILDAPDEGSDSGSSGVYTPPDDDTPPGDEPGDPYWWTDPENLDDLSDEDLELLADSLGLDPADDATRADLIEDILELAEDEGFEPFSGCGMDEEAKLAKLEYLRGLSIKELRLECEALGISYKLWRDPEPYIVLIFTVGYQCSPPDAFYDQGFFDPEDWDDDGVKNWDDPDMFDENRRGLGARVEEMDLSAGAPWVQTNGWALIILLLFVAFMYSQVKAKDKPGSRGESLIRPRKGTYSPGGRSR